MVEHEALELIRLVKDGIVEKDEALARLAEIEQKEAAYWRGGVQYKIHGEELIRRLTNAYAALRKEVDGATVTEMPVVLKTYLDIIRKGMGTLTRNQEHIAKAEETYFDKAKKVMGPEWKPGEATVARMRERFASIREAMDTIATGPGPTSDYWSRLVEQVRTGEMTLKCAKEQLAIHKEDDFNFLVGKGKVTLEPWAIASVAENVRVHRQSVEARFEAAAMEFATASRFLRGDRRARMADGAVAQGKKMEKMERVGMK